MAIFAEMQKNELRLFHLSRDYSADYVPYSLSENRIRVRRLMLRRVLFIDDWKKLSIAKISIYLFEYVIGVRSSWIKIDSDWISHDSLLRFVDVNDPVADSEYEKTERKNDQWDLVQFAVLRSGIE